MALEGSAPLQEPPELAVDDGGQGLPLADCQDPEAFLDLGRKVDLDAAELLPVCPVCSPLGRVALLASGPGLLVAFPGGRCLERCGFADGGRGEKLGKSLGVHRQARGPGGGCGVLERLLAAEHGGGLLHSDTSARSASSSSIAGEAGA